MDALKADSRAVVIAAARAQKAADYILGHQARRGEVTQKNQDNFNLPTSSYISIDGGHR